ncbi:efflux RND transporter periplasmic adaptor subunit [Xanthomonas maliensis]|uniref:efflux RND transporter periplasmic adaptor subunit n=1 Tax=Xanthomonas maliensis TaxID=1321368 RepID=UPI00068C269C|nr:efflux RND transporter periplasmic adaptor subunit [Xanthomonas maliensis]
MAACGSQPAATPTSAPAVEVAVAHARTVLPTAELPGRITSVRAAQVRARVPGIVLSRQFVEGADVKAGQVLFQIDPAPFDAAVARAQAELARAQAEQDNARAQFQRARRLVEQQVISRQDFETTQAGDRSAQAAVASAQAALRTAQLERAFATVRAPIDGRIGRALVTEGALVGQGGDATAMALVQQLDPIFADFRRPLADALRLRRKAQTDADAVRVVIDIPELAQTREGELLFSDMSVDEGTGTVSLRAQFRNQDQVLLPGMFVRVRAPNGGASTAVYVPQRAIQRDAEGQASVMVVDAAGKAQRRKVRTGAMVGTEWQLLDGLAPGERYVVSGAGKLQPGSVVHLAR